MTMNTAAIQSSWTGNQKISATSLVSLVWDRPTIPQGSENVLVSTDVLDKRASEVLGANGVKRFEEFKQYKDGWDHGNGKALSFRSVAIMERLINNFSGFPCEPSLFFTREGNLQLGWEDKKGKSVELEFCPDGIEFYVESKNIEGEVSISELGISELISYL